MGVLCIKEGRCFRGTEVSFLFIQCKVSTVIDLHWRARNVSLAAADQLQLLVSKAKLQITPTPVTRRPPENLLVA